MITKIRRQGGAAVVTIPPAMMKLMNAEIGSELSLVVDEGKLIARPVKDAKKRYTLAELLKGAEAVAALNVRLVAAQDGDAVGHEIF